MRKWRLSFLAAISLPLLLSAALIVFSPLCEGRRVAIQWRTMNQGHTALHRAVFAKDHLAMTYLDCLVQSADSL